MIPFNAFPLLGAMRRYMLLLYLHVRPSVSPGARTVRRYMLLLYLHVRPSVSPGARTVLLMLARSSPAAWSVPLCGIVAVGTSLLK